MSGISVDFIKGHMGGNKILLLDGTQLSNERLLPQALSALDDLCLSGHQAGICFPPERGGTVRVRVVSICGRDFIPTCGGLTQVLSRALVDSSLADRFPVEARDGRKNIVIEFDNLSINTEVSLQEGRFDHVMTDFTAFAQNLLLRGFERVDLGGLHAWRSGYFFVLDADLVRSKHPEVNFETMDDTAKELITLLQYRFLGATGLTSWDFTLFDRQAAGHGDVRAIFPHNVRIGFLEPSCGTGSVALALTLLTSGDWRQIGQTADSIYTLHLQTGGKAVMGGPDLTTVIVEKTEEGIGRVRFSNSNVQLVAQGSISL